jgi:hypothetical protein
VHGEVEQVKDVMALNIGEYNFHFIFINGFMILIYHFSNDFLYIERVLERGERIELLVDKTDNLNQQAFAFRKRSTALRVRIICIFHSKYHMYNITLIIIYLPIEINVVEKHKINDSFRICYYCE